MSSATSIDGRPDVAADVGLEARARAAGDGFRPIHFFILASLVAATAAVVLSRNPNPAHLILISLTIAAAGLASAGVYRMLAPLVAPESAVTRDPLSARARQATEREKGLVLRSLKELEFDRAMGKVSERDFDEMSGRLRARAVSLMKQLEQENGGYAAMVERDLQARLSAAPAVVARSLRQDLPPKGGSHERGSHESGIHESGSHESGSGEGGSHESGSRGGGSHGVRGQAAGPAVRLCAACETPNDQDAAFCKRCGARVA